MRYEKLTDLPKTIRTQLPKRAQELYLTAYQNAWDNYDVEEEPGDQQQAVAHRDAWAAIKREYVHDEESGLWHSRRKEADEGGEAPGVLESLKNMV